MPLQPSHTPPPDETEIKRSILRSLTRRFFLRFHLFILLAWTFCAGLLTTKLLWWLGMDAMWQRHILAILAAYFAFLLGVRLWLAYVDLGRHLQRRQHDGITDMPQFGTGSPRGEQAMTMRGDGGQFGGGGASGKFSIIDGAHTPVAEPYPAGPGGLGKSLLEGAGMADEGCLAALALAAVVALLVGAFSLGAYVVAEAPAALVEAAFEAMLAGGLLRTRRRSSEADWLGAVVRRTWKTVLAIVLVALAFSLAAQQYRPEARTIAQVFAPR